MTIGTQINVLGLRGVLAMITVYQRTLSPDHSWLAVFFPAGVCRFEPTCSEYMSQAVARFGWRGIILGGRRLSRCHPWGATGHDPVPRMN